MLRKLVYLKQRVNRALFSKALKTLKNNMLAALDRHELGKAKAYFILNEAASFNLFKNTLFVGDVVGLQDYADVSRQQLAPPKQGFSFKPNKTADISAQESVKVVHPAVFSVVLKDHLFNPTASLFYHPESKQVLIPLIKHEDQRLFNYTSQILVSHAQKVAFLSLPRKTVDLETGIFFGGNGTGNYYHFLVEILSKSMYLDRLGEEYKDFPLFFSESVGENKNLRALVSYFITDKSRRVAYLPDHQTYRAKNLLILSNAVDAPLSGVKYGFTYKSDYVLTRPETIDFIRKVILQKLAETGGAAELKRASRIFLARRLEGSLNRVYNQDEVMAALKPHGFQEVYLEDYSIMEQAAIVQHADMIAGPTGAAWTNIIFSKPGAVGICWMHENWGEFAAFPNIAAAVGFQLFYLSYSTKGGDLRDSYYLSPAMLQDVLLKVLDNTNRDKA